MATVVALNSGGNDAGGTLVVLGSTGFGKSGSDTCGAGRALEDGGSVATSTETDVLGGSEEVEIGDGVEIAGSVESGDSVEDAGRLTILI